MPTSDPTHSVDVTLELDDAQLPGDLAVPDQPLGLVIFAHGSGSSRHSPRNRHVAESLNRSCLATLLFDLLTPEEDELDRQTRAVRFDVALLGRRLAEVVDRCTERDDVGALPVGLFGASTGAAAALIAAAARPDRVRAVVSRGGRPDLAGEALPEVSAPTLLFVGGLDREVIEMNRSAAEQMSCAHEVNIVPGASHLFEEPGKLDEVAELAGAFFSDAFARQDAA